MSFTVCIGVDSIVSIEDSEVSSSANIISSSMNSLSNPSRGKVSWLQVTLGSSAIDDMRMATTRIEKCSLPNISAALQRPKECLRGEGVVAVCAARPPRGPRCEMCVFAANCCQLSGGKVLRVSAPQQPPNNNFYP